MGQQPADVFLLIGQSNMAGRGVMEDPDRKPIPGVYAFNKERKWVPAVDPIHFDKPDRIGVGLARSFAANLIEFKVSKSIGLVPAAFGGSSLEEWAPGSQHYKYAVQRLKAAIGSGGRLRGILWHQGEDDSTEARAGNYGLRFEAFVTSLRTDLGAPDCPVLVGQLGEFLKTMEFSRKVNEQLAMIPLHVPHTGFVSSQGLSHKGDDIHFDSASLREFGRRYALGWLALDQKMR